MLFIRQQKPELNVQSDSISAKVLFSQCLFTFLSVYLSQSYANFQLELSFCIKLFNCLLSIV